MKQLNITGSRKEYSIKNLRFNYDRLNDILYVYKKDSSAYSNVMIGEFHLEIDRKGEVVGIEILKASELLKEYGISRRILENIDGVDLRVVVKNNSMLVFLVIRALKQEKSATITMNNLESPVMAAIAEA